MDIEELLKIAIESDASDLHIKAGNNPVLRINGELKPITNFPKLTARDTDDLCDSGTLFQAGGSSS